MNDLAYIAGVLGISEATAVVGFVVLALWALVWKGLALWASARGKQQGWFIALLIINTMGLLEIIYLLFFKKKEGQ